MYPESKEAKMSVIDESLSLLQLFLPFMQDFFTISLGWFIFGGLPFDMVSVLLLFL